VCFILEGKGSMPGIIKKLKGKATHFQPFPFFSLKAKDGSDPTIESINSRGPL
jgi:hypothetical protein